MKSGAKIIDGRVMAEQIQQEVAEQINKLNLNPGLAVILVGHDPASELYVALKEKAAHKAGILFFVYRFESNAKEEDILQTINWLNKDKEIDAVLVQLPLPPHLDENKIIKVIDPDKDVDGFHPDNIKKLLANKTDVVLPGLHMGIIQLLSSANENLEKKKAIIIARSQKFTSTLSHLLKQFGTQPVVINPDHAGAKEKIKQADIAVIAVGKPNWLKKGDIKNKSIIIDVGTNKIAGGKTVGDVDFADCVQKAGWITPVPGGVGPMTVAMLLKNTVALALIHKKIKNQSLNNS